MGPRQPGPTRLGGRHASAGRLRALARMPASLTTLHLWLKSDRQAWPQEGACHIGKYSRKVKKRMEEIPTLQWKCTRALSFKNKHGAL